VIDPVIILHFTELGVVLLLFVIGLEVQHLFEEDKQNMD